MITSNDFDQIIENLFIGDFTARTNPRFKAILTLVEPAELRWINQSYPITVPHDATVLTLNVSDSAHEKNFSSILIQGINFIKENVGKHETLVHCVAGISRSVSIVVAYMAVEMWNYDIENRTIIRDVMKKHIVDVALKMIKKKRTVADPNERFIKDIKAWMDPYIRRGERIPLDGKVSISPITSGIGNSEVN